MPEWRVRPVVFLKQGDEFAAELLAEAGPDLAGVVQFAVAVVADQQGAEIPPGCRRPPPAADHELLPARALRLEPIGAAAGSVRRAGGLRDDAFKLGAAARIEELRPFAGDMLGISNAGAGGEPI
jgi:hypothetical protein